MRPDPVRLLAVYSAALTFGLVAVGTMAAAPRRAQFAEIDVQRLNVREPDGRLRLVISDRARFPGAILRGRETPFDRGAAGMLFYNDEDTENGGLIFSGGRGADGRVRSGGSLSFDQYQQDQVVVLDQDEDAGRRRAGLTIFDRPEATLDIGADVKLRADPAALQRAVEAGAFGRPRAFIGKTADHEAALELRDDRGRPRLRLSVDAGGAARITFLEADGRVVRTLAPS